MGSWSLVPKVCTSERVDSMGERVSKLENPLKSSPGGLVQSLISSHLTKAVSKIKCPMKILGIFEPRRHILEAPQVFSAL